jgi:hypothetical protein
MAMATTDTFGDLRAYYQSLHRFGLRLSETAARFQQLVRSGRWPEREVRFVYNQSDPADVLNRSIDITREFEFLVAVTGAFSSGKSSLLNVLLNYPDLLPVSAIPLTAVCTVIRYGETPRLRVRYVSQEECFARVRMFIDKPFRKEFQRLEQLDEAQQRPESFLDEPADRETLRRFARLIAGYQRITVQSPSFQERAPFMSGGGVVPVSTESGTRFRYYFPTPSQEKEYLAAGGEPERWVTKEWLALIRDVTLWVDSPLLHNDIVFLDLPGLNCKEDYHRRAIQEYCNMADCVMVIAFQPGNQADEEVVQNFKRLSANFRDKIFFIFNRVDQFQTEPEELIRSFDYLNRDCIGFDFPRDRCFLTSAYMARESRAASAKFYEEFEHFAKAFREFKSPLPALEELIGHATMSEDPGGVLHLRDCLQRFLSDDAYRTKIEEIVQNYETVLENLRAAASPHLEDILRTDERELLLRAALDFFRTIEQAAKSALYSFRYDYLRGSGNSSATLAQDLKRVLERTHQQIEAATASYFNQPIPTAPPREDPVREFDLRRIADDASNQLRRDFQEIVTSAVLDCVRQRLFEHLNRSKFRENIKNLFQGSPEWIDRLDRVLERFDFMLRHSILCKVRGRFFSMPRGRDLKRLERSVGLSELKSVLIKVFSEFYPTWIYQNIYSEIQDGLWLSFFLDSEELEVELKKFFDGCQGLVTSSEVLEKIKIPGDSENGVCEMKELAGVCREIEALLEEKESMKARHNRLSLVSQV